MSGNRKEKILIVMLFYIFSVSCILNAFDISGRIVDVINQTPVSGVTVSTTGQSVLTDAQGQFVLTGLSDGSYRIDVKKQYVSFAPFYKNISISGANVSNVDFDALVNTSIPGCQLWFDAADPNADGSAPSNGSLAAWKDKSGNGNDATQGTAANQPNVQTNALNGMALVNFDGVDDNLQFSENNSIRTVFWVVKESAYDSPEPHFLLGDYTSDSWDFNRGDDGVYWSTAWASDRIRNGSTYNGGVLVQDPMTEKIPLGRFNLVSLVTTDTVVADSITRDRTFTTRSWYGQIAEIIISNQAMSDTDRQAIENFLIKKWNAQIIVSGNGENIANGDSTPSLDDNTDFGELYKGHELEHEFEIKNEGIKDLSLDAANPVEITGSSAFTISQMPSSSVLAPGESVAFKVKFIAPDADATHSANLLIHSNDPDEGDFSFALKGVSYTAARSEISVTGNGYEILNGDNSPSELDGTDFSGVQVDKAVLQKFVIHNHGELNLKITNVTLTQSGTNEFIIVDTPSTVVAANDGETSLAIIFHPQSQASFSATLTINNNDNDEGTFTFDLAGKGVDNIVQSVKGLSLWLDGNDPAGNGILPGDGSSLNTWVDKSGNNNDATLPGGVTAPQVQANSINSKASVYFSGNGSYLKLTNSLNDIRTVFWVVNEEDQSNPHFLLGADDTFHFHRGANGNIWHLETDGNGNTSSYTSPNIINGETYLDGNPVDGTTTALTVNSTQMISLITTGPCRANQITQDRYLTDRAWKGKIAEIIIYNRPLNSGERRRVEAYLKEKWENASTTKYSITGTITGDVQDKIIVYLSGDSNIATVTDASGNYTFDSLLDQDAVTVTPSLSHLVFDPPNTTVTINAASESGVDFISHNVSTISGTITLDGTTDALAGVTLSIDQTHTAITDEIGEYMIEDVKNGQHTLTPVLDGYKFIPATRVYDINNADVTDADFDAVKLHSVSGTITYNGNPLSGVEVAVDATHYATTDASGVYEITNLDDADYTVTPKLTNYAFIPYSKDVTVAGADVTGIDFTAVDGYDISGNITYNGTGLSGVTVTVNDNYSAVTDASGNYTIADIAAGTYTVTPKLTDYAFTPYSQEVTVVDADISGIDFTAGDAYDISGNITYNGAPLAGVTVTVNENYSAVTDAAGDYLITDIGVGTYTVTPKLTDYAFLPYSKEVTVVDADISGIDFTAVDGYDVSGLVTLDGNPLQGVTVSVDANYSVVTAADGTYTIVDLPDGHDFTVTPELSGYIFTPSSEDISIAGADIPNINFTATKIYSISGAVVDEDGNPLAGVTVSVDDNHSAISETDGSYSILDLPAGDYTVTPKLTGYLFTPASQDVTVDDADIADIDFSAKVNFKPVANDDLYSTLVNKTLTIDADGILANDFDLDAAALTITQVNDVQNGTLDLHPDGSFSYEPNTDYVGEDSFSYTISDGENDSQEATVVIKVINDGDNHPPVAVKDDFFYISQNQSISIAAKGVLANDYDLDGDDLTAVLDSAPLFGQVTLNQDGSFDYTPQQDFIGKDIFSYKANDATDDSNIALVVIVVNAPGVNNPPTAIDDYYDAVVNSTLDISVPGVLINDFDAEDDSLSVEVVSQPAAGTLNLNADGSFTFQTDTTGTVSFTYKISDGDLYSNTAKVTINVSNIPNDPPHVYDDLYYTHINEELDVAADSGVLANDYDLDSASFSATLLTDVAHGALTFAADGSFTYTPEQDFSGEDSFTYKVSDGISDSSTATVVIKVLDTTDNHPPIAVIDDFFYAKKNTKLSVVTAGVLANDSDVDDDLISAVIVDQPLFGLVTLSADGSFEYTPNTDFTGIDIFAYTANDGTENSNIALVKINVTDAANTPPVALDDFFSTPAGVTLQLPPPGVLENDYDLENDNLTTELVDKPANGSLIFNADGSLEFMSNSEGRQTFTYRIFDGSVYSNTATVTIDIIEAPNNLPIATEDLYSVLEDHSIMITEDIGVLANDYDLDDEALSAKLITSVQHGTLTFNADGSFEYSPDAGYFGEDSFSYVAVDERGGESDTVSVVIKVLEVEENHPPFSLKDDFFYAKKNTKLIVPPQGVLANDIDEDGDSLTTVIAFSPRNGTLKLNADGSFEYTPDSDFVGIDLFGYKANDGKENGNTALVSIVVSEEENLPPVALDNHVTATMSVLFQVEAPGVLNNDFDVNEDDTLTVELVDPPVDGVFNLNSDGSFDFLIDSVGKYYFTYKAYDGVNYSNIATVTIVVNELPNDPPVAHDDEYICSESITLEISAPGVLKNDLDPNEQSLIAILVDTTEHGTLDLNEDGSFTYLPIEGFYGNDSFTYKANDGFVDSEPATVTIHVSPLKVTLGTPVTVKITDVEGVTAGQTFDKLPKIYAIFPNGKKGALKKDKTSFQPDSATGFWKKKYRLYDKKAVKSQGYANIINKMIQDLEVQLKVKGKIAGVKVDANCRMVTLVPPEIISVSVDPVMYQINVEGYYFGNKYPKVMLEPITGGKLIKCKVLKKEAYKFDPVTGKSFLQAVYKPQKTPAGEYWLVIDNKIGIGVINLSSDTRVLPKVTIPGQPAPQ